MNVGFRKTLITKAARPRKNYLTIYYNYILESIPVF